MKNILTMSWFLILVLLTSGYSTSTQFDIGINDQSGLTLESKPLYALRSKKKLNASMMSVDIQILKVNSLISDPIRGTTNPLRVPGAVIEYIIQPRNEGSTSPDNNTVVINDVIPQNTQMCVSSLCWPGGDFVRFTDGSPSSNLSFNFFTDVTFSNVVGGGAPYSYTPSPDSAGYDSSVTGFRVQPSGVFNNSNGSSPHPNFNIFMRVRID